MMIQNDDRVHCAYRQKLHFQKSSILQQRELMLTQQSTNTFVTNLSHMCFMRSASYKPNINNIMKIDKKIAHFFSDGLYYINTK